MLGFDNAKIAICVCDAILLFNRAPVRQPEKPPDVLVPLLGTFFIYAFAFAHLAPAPLRESLMPVALRDGFFFPCCWLGPAPTAWLAAAA